MRYWGGDTPPPWVREIAHDRARPMVNAEPVDATPSPGDIVLKPFIDRHKQLFRIETWNTHDLLEGPFETIREGMEAALELGLTARLTVWLDYSDTPARHDLDPVPLYVSDPPVASATSVP